MILEGLWNFEGGFEPPPQYTTVLGLPSIFQAVISSHLLHRVHLPLPQYIHTVFCCSDAILLFCFMCVQRSQHSVQCKFNNTVWMVISNTANCFFTSLVLYVSMFVMWWITYGLLAHIRHFLHITWQMLPMLLALPTQQHLKCGAPADNTGYSSAGTFTLTLWPAQTACL